MDGRWVNINSPSLSPSPSPPCAGGYDHNLVIDSDGFGRLSKVKRPAQSPPPAQSPAAHAHVGSLPPPWGRWHHPPPRRQWPPPAVAPAVTGGCLQVGRAHDVGSGRVVEYFANTPGVQFYTGQQPHHTSCWSSKKDQPLLITVGHDTALPS